MSWNTVILVLVVAAVAYFVWKQRGGGTADRHGAAAAPAASAAPAAGASGATPSPDGLAASLEEYRRRAPSNMINGKLTCNRCGSNLIRTADGAANCSSCGTTLYRT